MNMIFKVNFIFTLLTLFLYGCSFDTKGKLIDKYENPRKALIILDVQEDFTGSSALMPVDEMQKDLMIANLNSILDGPIPENLVVVYVRNVFPKSDRIANYFRKNAAVEGNPGTAFDYNLKIINGNIFDKNKPDMFTNPAFEKFLADNRINELFMAGVFADQCVFWSSKGALNRGYAVYYIQDAVACRNERNLNSAVEKIRKYGAVVIGTSGLHDYLKQNF